MSSSTTKVAPRNPSVKLPTPQRPGAKTSAPPASKARPASGSRLRAAKPAASKGVPLKGARPSTPPANDARPAPHETDIRNERSIGLSVLLAGIPAFRLDRDLHAFLCSLAALVENVERTAQSHAAMVVATAVRSIIVLAANYLFSKQRGQLRASGPSNGSMAFLDWSWRGKPVEMFAKKPGPAQTDHSDPLRDLRDDLAKLLEKHKPADLYEKGPFADLYSALANAEIMASKHSLDPKAGHLEKLAAAFRPAPPLEATAADTTMLALGDHLLSIHEHMREVQDALVDARFWLTADDSGDHSKVVNAAHALSQTDRGFFYLADYLTSAMITITGCKRSTLPNAAGQLAGLVDQLGEREASWCVSADKARAKWLALPADDDKS